MAAFNKFNSFVGDLGLAKINLNTDSILGLLTNTAPVAGDTVVDTTTGTCTVKSTSNAAEIAAGNGYTKKGLALATTSYSQTGGVGKLVASADQVLTASGAVTVAGGTRFARASAMTLAILRAGINTATFVDATPITSTMRTIFRAMVGVLRLVQVAAVGGAGLYNFNVQTPDGGTFRTGLAGDAPLLVTLPTSEVVSLALDVAAPPHDGWFLVGGLHQRATLVATSAAWLPITGEADVISDTRRLCTIPLASAITLAAAIEGAGYVATLQSYVTGSLPHFSIGAEEITGTALVTLDASTYPHPLTHTDPVLIEGIDPVDPMVPVPVLTDFVIVFP